MSQISIWSSRRRHSKTRWAGSWRTRWLQPSGSAARPVTIRRSSARPRMAGVASGIGGNKVRECLLDLWGFANGDLDEGSISLRGQRCAAPIARDTASPMGDASMSAVRVAFLVLRRVRPRGCDRACLRKTFWTHPERRTSGPGHRRPERSRNDAPHRRHSIPPRRSARSRQDAARSPHRRGYRIRAPNALAASSTASAAVAFSRSRIGLTSTISNEPSRPDSATSSIARCASR